MLIIKCLVSFPVKHSLTNFPRNSWHDPPTSQLFTSKPLFPQLTHINSNSHDDDVGEEGSDEITTTHEPLPYFSDPINSVNVSTQLGTNVHLHCRVDNLRGKTVSWMRRKGDQLTLITFGHHTYSSDSRYSLEFEEPNDWKLLVQYANERDDGAYECQVSSHPPLVLLVNLAVIGELVLLFFACFMENTRPKPLYTYCKAIFQRQSALN